MSENDDPNFQLKIVGKFRTIKFGSKGNTYKRGILLPPIGLLPHVLKFNPDVIISAAFSIWTMIAVVLKPFTKWKIIIIYDGSSPEIDVTDSKIRIFARRLMTRFTDAFLTNTVKGKNYLTDYLNAGSNQVFARPYLVASKKFLSKKSELNDPAEDLKHPVFLYIGLLVKRKGIDFLLNACSELRKKGFNKFTLLVVGDGEDRSELETLTRELGIDENVKWTGWVDYESLGHYFDVSDVFVFPTLEDIWGTVVTEAMSCGKPILCSRLAGAHEMVTEGENGYTFDPVEDDPEVLAELMTRFIKDPELTTEMGKKSEQYISYHTPEAIVRHMKNIIELVYVGDTKNSKTVTEYSKN